MARSVGDFDVVPLRRRSSRRGVALLVAIDLALLASGAGFLIGQAGGGDREAAILAGRRSGALAGRRAGFGPGYAAGLRAGRAKGLGLSYRAAYQAADARGRKP
ncbi:MAG TPA: hypothetical protein VHY83_02955 [Solirubrobacteraceae bacterium]|nr:hypothetical protein [Solirubrobacteraceae bacterium]